MKAVEVTGYDLRVVVIRMKRPGSALSFVFIPLPAPASRRFYEDVRARVTECDLVVAQRWERPPWPLRIVNRLRTLRMGLVSPRMEWEITGIPVVRVGLTWTEIWRRQALRLRALEGIALPVVACMALFTSRRAEASTMERNQEDLLNHPLRPALFRTLHDAVKEDNRLLADALADIHRLRSAEAIQVAVPCGVQKALQVIRELSDSCGYVACEGEYLTAFEL